MRYLCSHVFLVVEHISSMEQNRGLPDLETLAAILEQVICLSTPSSSSTKSPVSDFVDISGLFSQSGDGSEPSQARDNTGKLSDVLACLDYEDERCIFIVRKISKLGLTAHDSLMRLCSQFGQVRRILLLPSRGRGDTRLRPASMGFVVMQHPDHCANICLSQGYRVNNVDIQVQRFIRNNRTEVGDGFTREDTHVPPGILNGPTGSASVGTSREMELLAQAILDTLEI